MQHETLDAEARLRAVDFALGILSRPERETFARHLPGCATCRREVERLQDLAESLALLVPEREPAPGTWEAIRARLAVEDAADPAHGLPVQCWKSWAADAPAAVGGIFVRASRGLAAGELGGTAWEPTGTPGIEAQRLYVDGVRRTATMLIRMAPGASYPAHRHGGPEECYVLQGELAFDDVHMRAGSYLRAEAGSVHRVQSTAEGCVLLIVSSLDDELIEPE